MIAADDLRYRPTIATDGPALFRLFQQVHTTEIATLAVDAATRAAFASMEYVEQRVRTSAEFPDAVDVAIETGDRLCGRMMTVMREGGIQLIQLGVLVEHRGQGIGTLAMRRLARIAEEHGCPIWLRADAGSQDCRGFLERVGFSVSGHGGRLLVEPARAVVAA
ncbi:GNAT family N-acetyltransferase [Humibacter sp.]|uniref:GNAT family N-acetyltransferase n=1 Tax=Humibacter sp. TaxID=1940291 RepID=UPI003F7E29B7